MELVLIDAHAILHRAYHALPPLTNKEGVQTNAVYGFVSMLLRLLEELKPTHLAVAFDMPGPVFRQKIWTQYQEKRPEVSSNLIDQFPLAHELLDKLNISHYQLSGYEADDIIGTIAKQAVGLQKIRRTQKIRKSEKSDKSDKSETLTGQKSEFSEMSDGLEVIIVTGDRDLLQLVNDQVKVLVPVKGFGQTKIYTRELVKQEFGVEPAQWVDVKALKGDSSDNYPGVRGIGPKTAQDLIAKFGNLENLYKHLDELQLKLKLKLAEGVEDAGLSKKLATIVAGVPGVKLQLDKVAVAEIDWEAGAKYMREKLGFRSLADRIQNLKFKGQNSNSKVKSEDKNEAASVADSGEPRQLGLI